MMFGVSARWLGMVSFRFMVAVGSLMRMTSAVRMVDADTARVVRDGCLRCSSEDGGRS